MIHVQIASELTADGVRGVRWVLLEAAEPLPPEAELATAPAVATATRCAPGAPAPVIVPPSASAATDAVADSLHLRLLKALVVALGLGAALWTAAVQIGPPRRVMPAVPAHAPSVTLPAKSPPAAPALPVTVPEPPAAPPTAPASAGLPRLTASL